MAVAVPIATAAISAYSAYRARKSNEKIAEQARTPTDQEAAAFGGAEGRANRLGDIGSMLYGQGQSALGPATSYYQTLLGRGGKEAMQSATAPAAENISDIYGGGRQSRVDGARGASAEPGDPSAGGLRGPVAGRGTVQDRLAGPGGRKRGAPGSQPPSALEWHALRYKDSLPEHLEARFRSPCHRR